MRGLEGVLCCVVLTGCGAGAADVTDDDLGGMGVPRQFPSETFPGERQEVRARVQLAPNGCFLATLPGTADRSRYLVVWPTHTEQGSSGDELRLPDGTAVTDGDLLTGVGSVMPTSALEGYGGDGYWDFAVGFCTEGASHVLVLDSVDGRSLRPAQALRGSAAAASHRRPGTAPART